MAVSMLEARPGAPGARSDATSQEFRQRPVTLCLAALRTFIGLAAVGGVGFSLAPGMWGAVVLAIVACLFVLYFIRAVIRHLSIIRIDMDRVSVVGPWPQSLEFADLDVLTLRYFSTRRDGENGWMNLTLKSGRCRISLDSDHPAFVGLASRALSHARRNRLALSPATIANARAIEPGPFFDGKTG